MAISLAGRRILIADRVIGGLELGSAIADLFPRLGAKVAFLDCTAGAGTEAAGGLEGPDLYLTADILDEGAVGEQVDVAVAALGGLDVLIHNAQFAPPTGQAEALSVEAFDLVMRRNVTGTYILNRAVFPHLREHGGAIVNQVSTGAVAGAQGKAAFSAAKGAVLAWTRSIALEWGAYAIRANAVAPALMSSRYAEALRNAPAEVRAREEALTRLTVVLDQERGTPERDYAPIMAFLASEDAHHLTGQVFPIDGGVLMMR